MRTYLYRQDVPGGRIFTDDQLADAIHDGWVDSPDTPPHPPQAPTAAPQASKRVTPKKDVLTMTVPVARKAIMKERSPEALRAILERENTRDRGPRKGVVDAVEERIGELETAGYVAVEWMEHTGEYRVPGLINSKTEEKVE